MKKNYFIALLALVCNFAFSQVQVTAYKGAFAPAPTAMWTDSWTNFNPNAKVYGAVTEVIAADITTSRTLDKTKVYELSGLITVRNNATLTIPAGTVIRSAGAGAALVITRGSKLIANGTAAEPIVFTSKNEEGSRNRGDWGGIVLLGKGRYNVNNGVNYIEGISQNVNTEFGGGLTPDDNDNSGSLKYVRIEFAGYVFSPNNELNGLTMGAVGKGTTIDYVQVSYSNDDSFEWFGGSVNCKHLVAFNGLDDDFDTDNGYKGIVQFGLSIKDPLAADISTSECFESDNNSGGAATAVSWGDFTSAIFTNFTCIGANQRPTPPSGFVSPNSLHDKALRIRRASKLSVFNSIFLDFKKGLVLESLLSNGYALDNGLKFKNNLIVCPSAALFSAPDAKNANPSANPPVVATTPTNTEMVNWYAALNNTTATASTGILTRAYATDAATNYLTITGADDTVNIDYRPLSDDAKTGASFTDSFLSGLVATGSAPGVSNLTLCKGVVASPLTANMTATGVSLRWYTSLTTATYTTIAPKPTTTTVGTKNYYVAEVDANGAVSSKATITVTIVASPTVPLAAITGASDAPAIKNVSAYIGTETEVTYTVATSSEEGVTYFWTVPLGATIVSGQDSNTITVKFKNVAAGLLKVGNITVQAKNAGDCLGKASVIALTAKLPTAPAKVVMTNGDYSDSSVAITSFAKYMGTTTELTLTAVPSTSASLVAASSYVWELPTGVNLITAATDPATADDTKFYGSYPFTVAITRPTAVGNTYYQVITKTYQGITVATASKFVVGGKLAGTAGLVAPVGGYMATSATDTTALVDQSGNTGVYKAYAVGVDFTTVGSVTVNPAYPIIASTSNAIKVKFNGVTSPSVTTLYVGARAKNGVGVSVSNNASPLTSKAKLLKLTAAAPAKVTKIYKTNTTTLANATSEKIVTSSSTTDRVYDIFPSPLAQTYVVTPPAGCSVNSGVIDAPLEISSLTFTITYPANYVSISASPKLLKVAAKNLIATSANLEYKILSVAAPARYQDVEPKSEALISNTEMYPNPASDVVNINITVTSDGVLDMTIYSFDGTIVSESKGLRVATGVNSFTENVSKLNKGIYLVRFTNSTSNEVVTKKLIKN